MTQIDTAPSKTIAEFCAAENISKSVYYDLRRRNLGPEESRIVGTTIVRITNEAHAAWRERMAELAKSKSAELEAARRRAQTAEAGKIAAQSPRHVSRRRGSPAGSS
jgi:formiminotetrahydrofolate cyclodeaminase